jgi:hypothetical protein
MDTISSLLDSAMDRVLRELTLHEIGSPEYAKRLNALSELQRMKDNNTPASVSKDTVAIVGANLLGILMIIMHEHLHPITTKAIGLLIKPRI